MELALAVYLFSVALYVLPTIVALARNHPNIFAIAILNIFLGWTFVGWVAALVWAVIHLEREPRPDQWRHL